jgi:hypothetical protein
MAAAVWHCWVGTGRLLALGAARNRLAVALHVLGRVEPALAAVIEHIRGRHQRSARLMGSARTADGADNEVMAFRTATSMALYRHYLPLVRNALGADQARRLRDEGRAMATDEGFAHALEGIEAAKIDAPAT